MENYSESFIIRKVDDALLFSQGLLQLSPVNQAAWVSN